MHREYKKLKWALEKIGRYLRWLRADLSHLKCKPTVTEVSRPVQAALKTVAKSTKRIVPLGTFTLPWLRFFRDYSSAVRQMPAFPLRHGDSTKVPAHRHVPSAATTSLWLRTPESLPSPRRSCIDEARRLVCPVVVKPLRKSVRVTETPVTV